MHCVQNFPCEEVQKLETQTVADICAMVQGNVTKLILFAFKPKSQKISNKKVSFHTHDV